MRHGNVLAAIPFVGSVAWIANAKKSKDRALIVFAVLYSIPSIALIVYLLMNQLVATPEGTTLHLISLSAVCVLLEAVVWPVKFVHGLQVFGGRRSHGAFAR